jgi:hypothetical protein
VQTSNYWNTEEEEGQKRPNKYRDMEQPGRVLVWEYLTRADRGSNSGDEWLIFWK